MALHLTPALLEAAYELLRVTPPFKRWKLPHADDVEFHVSRHRDKFGDYCDSCRMRVSANTNKELNTIIATVAHEMVHAHLHHIGFRSWETHGPRFNKLAAQVCRAHGWQLEGF